MVEIPNLAITWNWHQVKQANMCVWSQEKSQSLALCMGSTAGGVGGSSVVQHQWWGETFLVMLVMPLLQRHLDEEITGVYLRRKKMLLDDLASNHLLVAITLHSISDFPYFSWLRWVYLVFTLGWISLPWPINWQKLHGYHRFSAIQSFSLSALVWTITHFYS